MPWISEPDPRDPIDDADLFEYWEWLRRSTPATITELAERISYSLKQTKRKLDSGEEKKWMSQSWDTQKD